MAVALAAALAAAPASAAPARVAFANGQVIASVDADGANRAVLHNAAPGTAGSPDWSPDGASIALTATSTSSHTKLHVMAGDGSGLRRLTTGARGAESSPAWSPDGSQIAFVRTAFSRRWVHNALVTIAPDGSGERVLLRRRSKLLAFYFDPEWAPDGRSIVFSAARLDRNQHYAPSLRSIPADGGRARLFMRRAQSLVWSPDGARVAYVSVAERNERTCGSDTCNWNGEIHLREASGDGPPTRLTRTRADEQSPAWSPDGQRIAFSSDRNYPLGQSHEIYSMRPDGSCVTWLTNGAPASHEPTWQPGANRSSDPGACGGVARDPIVAVDLRRARTYRSTPAYWLGPVAPNGLLLSEAGGNSGGAWAEYTDCAQFDADACPLPFAIVSAPVCEREPDPLSRYDPDLLHVVDGLLVYRPPGPNDGADVFTGRTKILTGIRSLKVLRTVIGELRLLGEDTPAELPRSAFPGYFWRNLERSRTRRARALLREFEAYGAGRLDC